MENFYEDQYDKEETNDCEQFQNNEYNNDDAKTITKKNILQEENKILREENKRLREENDELQEEYTNILNSHERQEQEITDMRQYIDELENGLEECRTHNSQMEEYEEV